jgi:hypothetical protein
MNGLSMGSITFRPVGPWSRGNHLIAKRDGSPPTADLTTDTTKIPTFDRDGKIKTTPAFGRFALVDQ